MISRVRGSESGSEAERVLERGVLGWTAMESLGVTGGLLGSGVTVRLTGRVVSGCEGALVVMAREPEWVPEAAM